MSLVSCFFAAKDDGFNGKLTIEAALQYWHNGLRPGGREHPECRCCGTCRKENGHRILNRQRAHGQMEYVMVGTAITTLPGTQPS